MTTILLVEDQSTLRQLLSEVLEFSGYQVTTTADGAEALALLQSGTYLPDLILSDLLMEPMGGAELLRAISSEWWRQEIPFIMMSAPDQISELAPELRHEIDGVIIKPFGIKDALASVQLALVKQQRKNQNRRQDRDDTQRFA
jgi:two-component system response regulator MprA